MKRHLGRSVTSAGAASLAGAGLVAASLAGAGLVAASSAPAVSPSQR